MAIKSRNDKRVKRHKRARKNLVGTPEKPRLCVFRSNKNISAQVIDDTTGRTLVSASSLDKDLKAEIEAEGGKVAGSVSAKTDYLITNDPNSGSSKNRAARELGVAIITEDEIIEMLSGGAE